jgi:hypothetical protein
MSQSIDCGTFDTEMTQDATPAVANAPKKTRTRKRSISVQLQQALDDAAKAMSSDISVQKLIQTRIACLLKMQARERSDSLKRALAEVERLTVENERLKAELAQALAKTTIRQLDPVQIALAKLDAKKGER